MIAVQVTQQPSKCHLEVMCKREKYCQKYSAYSNWKSMEVALTSEGIYLARPGEDYFRETNPLDEVVEVKKSNSMPESASDNCSIQDIPIQR